MKNETLQVLQQRTSLRNYSKQMITKEEEDKIIECAMLAPTAGNQMLYSMILIKDQARKEWLSESCDHQPFMATAPLIIVFVADHHRWFEYYQKNGVKEFCDNTNYVFEAPQESDLLLAIEDAMCAAQNAVIAAESMGIGSCYIGDIVEHGEAVSDFLQLPQYTMPIACVTFGHYKEDHKKIFRKRFDRQFVAFEETYKQLSEEDYTAMFKEEETKYTPNNSYHASNYAQQFYARKTGADFSKEMARSVRVWLKRWDGKIL